MRWCTLLAVGCSLAATASAQDFDSYGPLEGESLLTFAGSFSSVSNDFDTRLLTFQIGGGYFLSLEHEVGGYVLLANADADGEDANIVQLAPYYNYNYRYSSRTWFYGGPHLGLLFFEAGDEDDTQLTFGAHTGIRQWLTTSASIFFEPRYTKSSDFDEFSILFGLNLALGG